MLNSLYIKNYRNLKNFRIRELSRINLITGKNNTGKSAILEALSIYAAKGNPFQMYKLLEKRGEYIQNNPSTEERIRLYSSLFAGRVIGFDVSDFISIGENQAGSWSDNIRGTLVLRLVKFVFDDEFSKRRILDDEDTNDYEIGIETRFDDKTEFSSFLRKKRGEPEKFQFVDANITDNHSNSKLFDNVILTEREKYVVDALRIVEPSIERIAFVEGTARERVAVVKLTEYADVLPLRSMGDGINRILTIILAMVNSVDGFLLVDEFENGLHYSIQEQIWEIIFRLAERLNIQVFVTTHSSDCIRGFEGVLNDPLNRVNGKLIRLDHVNGEIKEIEYTSSELKIAVDQNIETR